MPFGGYNQIKLIKINREKIQKSTNRFHTLPLQTKTGKPQQRKLLENISHSQTTENKQKKTGKTLKILMNNKTN